MTPTQAPRSAAVAVELRGKLAPPHYEFDAVRQPTIEALARSAVLAKLVTVQAPAGYGKTVFLCGLYQALQTRGHRCLWLTLDDRDTSVGSLLYLLGSALTQTSSAAPQSPSIKETPGDPRAEVDRILNHLVRLHGPTALFIDNLSFCRDPQLATLLERLVFNSGPGLRLVLSGIDAMPIDGTRAKLELGCVDVGVTQLAFDASSTAQVLCRAGLPPMSTAMLARVQERTEGWPAAVRLLQILLSQTSDAGDVLERFGGGDSDIAAVLTRRVLAAFEPRLVRFLIELALVREFSAELAASMTGNDEAGAWLELLLARNVLIFPLDRSRRWLRMHTLLRQFLLAEGRGRLSRERRQELLTRAAQWHAEQGDDVSALEAALDGPVIPLAEKLLDRVARAIVSDQGRLTQYVGWVEQLSSAGAPLSIEAHAWYVWALCFSLQYERAQRALDSLDHRLAEPGTPSTSHTRLRSRVGLLRVVISVHLDTTQVAKQQAAAWLDEPRARDALAVATVATGAAVAALAWGESDAARRHMEMALGAVERTESAYGKAWVGIVRAAVELTDGEPAVADKLLLVARERAAKALGEDAQVVATIDFLAARALADMGRMQAARDRGLRGLALAARHGVPETTIHGLTACVALWQGEDEGPFARESLDAVARSYPARVRRALAILQVRRLLQLDRRDEAFALVTRHLLDAPTTPEDEVLEHWTDRILLDVELAVARGNSREALTRIDARLKAAQKQTRPREMTELHLLAAAVHVQTNRARHAVRHLTLAILAAARYRLVRPFLERIPVVAEVLADARDKDFGLTQPEALALLHELRELTRSAAPGRPPASASTMDERSPTTGITALTPRELQLLEMVGLGMSNQLIADRFSLTLPTVKWHLYNLYTKLEVKSRAAALAKARTLNLLAR